MAPRIVLITGANSGVGLATSKVLFSQPSSAYHVIIASRTLAKAQSAKDEITSEHPTVDPSLLSIIQLDVTDNASVTAARDLVEKEHGHLDALINNAAAGNTNPDVYTRFRACLDTNTIGPAVVADAFRPLLLRSPILNKGPGPYSIFVSSGAGSFHLALERERSTGEKHEYPPNGNAYIVSKAALNMIALQEHVAHGGEGLKVFAMCPGFVVSNLRGTSEEARTGRGKAGPASVSGETLLSILEGRRDGDVGKFVNKDGVYEW